jgi:sporulation protein YlmC with PRC-barrel domain
MTAAVLAFSAAGQTFELMKRGGHASFSDETDAGPPQQVAPHRATGLRGMQIKNMDGIKLGTVRDLAFETGSGRVAYLMVSSGGSLFGIGAEVRAVPVRAISDATAERNTLALDLPRNQWNLAPEIRRDEMASMDSQRLRTTDKFFAVQSRALEMARNNHQDNGVEIPPTPTGRATGERERPPTQAIPLKLASDVIGKDLVNRQNEVIGEVSDLLVDLTGQQIAFAIVSAGRLFRDRDRMFAVPARALSLSADRKRVVIDASRAQFEKARPFDAAAWLSASPTGPIAIFQYDLTDEAALRRPPNQQDQLASSDPTEGQSDRRISQQLRQALMRDDSLSMSAKNVKIITSAGEVTLRGAVNSEAERDTVLRIAHELAGGENVIDRLEVRRR